MIAKLSKTIIDKAFEMDEEFDNFMFSKLKKYEITEDNIDDFYKDGKLFFEQIIVYGHVRVYRCIFYNELILKVRRVLTSSFENGQPFMKISLDVMYDKLIDDNNTSEKIKEGDKHA